MAKVLLDTTVLIDFIKGRPRTVERLRQLRDRRDESYTCAINVEEVSRGLRPQEEETLLRLLGGLEVAPLGIPEGRLAGYWGRTLAKRGRTVSPADALIAAAAIGVGARVATGNPRDYRFPGLDVEHWPSGE